MWGWSHGPGWSTCVISGFKKLFLFRVFSAVMSDSFFSTPPRGFNLSPSFLKTILHSGRSESILANLGSCEHLAETTSEAHS